MPEQPSVPPFPRWLIVVDLVAGLCVIGGLLLRNGVLEAPFLPPGTDLLLLGLGGLGIVGCGVQFGRYAIATAASKSSR
ncbi:hypothetical protein [Cognatilysobacter segetis]|uniref:hypothetical protein n=1 Tax=Cognatilysobacter segetis TaxID=2492394 RepID=UPI00105C62B9|nr:hypothetical protein [Lysobacter segetis]